MSAAALRAVRGAIHVHTAYDDGGLPIEAVVAAAVDAELDYLVVTDHKRPFAAYEGWQGRTRSGPLLVLAGAEQLACPGHEALALGPGFAVETRTLAPAAMLALLRRLGAGVFLAHPQGCPRVFNRSLVPWTEWESADFDGLEVWSYMHDWYARFRLWRLPAMCRRPGDWIRGPDPEILARWDELATRRRVAGIGALDTHAPRLPLGLDRLLPWARGGILPYGQNFAAFSHYALVPETWGGNDAADLNTLLDALVRGRGWMAHEALAPARGFRFHLRAEDGLEHPPGSLLPFRGGLRIQAEAPQPARLRLLSRGRSVAETEGTRLDCAAAEPGEYRLEAWLGKRLWILTNHIYLREMLSA